MNTAAELFNEFLQYDTDVELMIRLVTAAGGGEWGRNAYKVDFPDGSWWSAAVFYPEDRPPYFNGSAKEAVSC